MPRADRARLKESVRKKLARIPADKLLPMPYSLGAGRITEAEREEYRQRRDARVAANRSYLDNFSRPTSDVLDEGWYLLGWSLPQDAHRSEEEKVSLVLLAALFVCAGTEKRHVSYNDVFDTLCRAYSDHFIASPARMARDMRPITAKRARRDLLLNNIDVNRLWRFMVKSWPGKRKKKCLYSIRRLKTGSAHYIAVELRSDRNVDNFVSFLTGRGRKLSPPRGIQLDFVEEKPVRKPKRANPKREQNWRFCAEVPYNVVELGCVSRQLLKLQSQARLLFNIGAFNKDYQRALNKMQSMQKSIRRWYGVDPEQSEQLRRLDFERPQSGAPGQTTGRISADGEYWSPRDETLYYRSIEHGLRMAKPRRSSRVAKMAREKRERKPEEWDDRSVRFLKWRSKHGRLPRPRRKPSVVRICEAATASWSWRERVRTKLAVFDRARQLVRTYQAVYEQVKGQTGVKPIRSDFIRLINRRYQPLHMWPSYVSAKTLAEEEFDAVQQADELDDAESMARDPEFDEARTYRHRWFQVQDPETNRPGRLTSRDISSSQTQIVATLLGIEELERRTMASGTQISFKEWLAELAFDMHKEGIKQRRMLAVRSKRDDSAAKKLKKLKPRQPKHIFSLRVIRRPTRRLKNYTGKTDAKLQNLCKTLWMTASYGSDPRTVHQLQRNDPDTFGPGWSIKDARWFLREINRRFPEMDAFLEACRYIANRIARRRPKAGVQLIDPSDRSRVRWHPVLREEQALSNNGQKLMLSLPASKNVTSRFLLNGEYPVDGVRLRRMMAPCVVHMLDAYFSTLVMRQLAQRGVRNFVGIHDCWYVARRVKSYRRIVDGDQVVAQAINKAAAEWYQGLGPVYSKLLVHVKGNKEFEALIRRAQRLWRKRRREGYVPHFLSKAE